MLLVPIDTRFKNGSFCETVVQNFCCIKNDKPWPIPDGYKPTWSRCKYYVQHPQSDEPWCEYCFEGNDGLQCCKDAAAVEGEWWPSGIKEWLNKMLFENKETYNGNV
jgi:hypothetical protein